MYSLRTQGWIGVSENGNFPLIYVTKMSILRGLGASKSLQTPLRNIKMAGPIIFFESMLRIQRAREKNPPNDTVGNASFISSKGDQMTKNGVYCWFLFKKEKMQCGLFPFQSTNLNIKQPLNTRFGQVVICFLITLYEKKRAKKNYEPFWIPKQHLIRNFLTLCRSSNGPEKAPYGLGAMFESDAGPSITLPESKQTVFQVKIFISPTLLIFYTILLIVVAFLL